MPRISITCFNETDTFENEWIIHHTKNKREFSLDNNINAKGTRAHDAQSCICIEIYANSTRYLNEREKNHLYTPPPPTAFNFFINNIILFRLYGHLTDEFWQHLFVKWKQK